MCNGNELIARITQSKAFCLETKYRTRIVGVPILSQMLPGVSSVNLFSCRRAQALHAKVAGGQQNRAQYIDDNMGGNGNSAGSIAASGKESDGIVNHAELAMHNSKRNYVGQQNQKARQGTACNGEPPCLYCPVLETENCE